MQFFILFMKYIAYVVINNYTDARDIEADTPEEALKTVKESLRKDFEDSIRLPGEMHISIAKPGDDMTSLADWDQRDHMWD